MSHVLRVQLLGGFSASAAERTVAANAWRLRKAKTLLKLLALEPAHALHRDQVTDALWPSADPDAGRNNLHQVVHAARRALSTIGVDGSAAVATQDDLLVLGGDIPVVTDVEELQAAVHEARTAGRRDDVVRLLRDSPGELLPEDSYETWAQPHATAFREWRTQVVMDVADALLEDGRSELAVVLLAPVVRADPLHEPAVRTMIRALTASGRRSEALLVYERLRDTLREELAAEPEAQTRDVFRATLTGAAGASGPVATVPAPRAPIDLPAPLTTLVGRVRELAETKTILGRTRLLTLTGMGGVGKTALGIELARTCATDYPGGVHLVELGAVVDGEQVAAQLARALRLQLPPESAAVESIVTQVRDRQMLVVLDNCEHLLDACAHVVSTLLRGCPRLRVVATSREALRIEGEVSWRVPSLDLPDPDRTADPRELSEVASVELFVRRATAALPSFALTEGNAGAVAEICYRLDGIPLALELAAACVPVLSPQQIADRLGDSLNLLRRGDRATITRQQTLEATLAWSHDLLGPSEQVVFRRLAVFAGLFTIDAVESVCGDGLGAARVLTAIARLVDTSLVVADARPDVVRYRLLETVRQYAVERLRAAGDLSDTQRRHYDWYLAFAQARDPECSLTPTALPSTLDVEHDNLRAALTWALQHEPPLALELAVALWRYWLARGLFAEGRRWLEAALASAPEPSVLRARGLIALAVFDVRRGSGTRLAQLGAEAVGIHRALPPHQGLAQTLHTDAVLAFMRGDWDACWERTVEARHEAAECGWPQLDVSARHLQATVLTARGRVTEARAAFEEVRESLARLPESTAPFLSPVLLGFVVDRTATGSPRIHFEETVLLGRLVGVRQARAHVLCDLADLARLDGDLDSGLELLRAAATGFAEVGDRDGEALAVSRRGCLHRVRGEFRDGRDALTRSLWLRRLIGDRRAIGLTKVNAGVLTAAQGDVTAGVAAIEDTLASFARLEDRAACVGVTLTLGSVLADAGAYDAAEQRLREALRQSPLTPGNARATAWGYAVLADVLSRLGREQDADQARQDARAGFAAVGAVDGTASVSRAPRGAQSRR